MMIPVAVSAKRCPCSEPRVHHRLPMLSEPNAVGAIPPDWFGPLIATVFAIGCCGPGIIGGAFCGCTRPYICCCGGANCGGGGYPCCMCGGAMCGGAMCGAPGGCMCGAWGIGCCGDGAAFLPRFAS